MPRWEYREIVVSAGLWTDSTGQRDWITTEGSHPFSAALCDELDADGWELIGVAGDPDSYRLFFKRPRE
jgi:hypothetical protein